MSEIDAQDSPLYRHRQLTPEPRSDIDAALQADPVARRVLAKGHKLEDGEQIGLRLNLNLLKSRQVLVHTIHKGGRTDGYKSGKGLYRNPVIAYLPVAVMRHCYFNVDQKTRERIASGIAAKSPMASVDGLYRDFEGEPCWDGIELSFNPKRGHAFSDANNFGVAFAEIVTVVGHRCYARGKIRYFTDSTAPIRAGNAPSQTRFASQVGILPKP